MIWLYFLIGVFHLLVVFGYFSESFARSSHFNSMYIIIISLFTILFWPIILFMICFYLLYILVACFRISNKEQE